MSKEKVQRTPRQFMNHQRRCKRQCLQVPKMVQPTERTLTKDGANKRVLRQRTSLPCKHWSERSAASAKLQRAATPGSTGRKRAGACAARVYSRRPLESLKWACGKTERAFIPILLLCRLPNPLEAAAFCGVPITIAGVACSSDRLLKTSQKTTNSLQHTLSGTAVRKFRILGKLDGCQTRDKTEACTCTPGATFLPAAASRASMLQCLLALENGDWVCVLASNPFFCKPVLELAKVEQTPPNCSLNSVRHVV
jgi:hypothetical protein